MALWTCSNSGKSDLVIPSGNSECLNCPNWEDNPGGYQFIATFVAVIIINHDMEEGDILAAFDLEGNVRGVGVQLIPPFGPYEGQIVYEISIRSNTIGDILLFKYYDVSDDVVLDIAESYEFIINDQVGDAIEPAEFSISNTSIINVQSSHLVRI